MSDAPFLTPRGRPQRIAAVIGEAVHVGLGEILTPVVRFFLSTVRLVALLAGMISLWTVATYDGPHQLDVVCHALVRTVLLGLIAAGAARLRSRLQPHM